MAIDRNGEVRQPLWTDGLVAEAQIAAGVSVLGGETRVVKASLLEKGLTPIQVHKFIQSASEATPEEARASITFNLGLVADAGLVDVNLTSLEAGFKAVGEPNASRRAFIVTSKAMDRKYWGR